MSDRLGFSARQARLQLLAGRARTSSPSEKPPLRDPPRRDPAAPARLVVGPPRPPPATPRRSTRTYVLMAGLVVALAVAGLVAMVGGDGGGGEQQPTRQPDTSLEVDMGAPPPPVSLRPDTTYTQVTVLADGRLRVEQWIRSTHFLFGVSLAVPTDPELRPGAVQATDVRVVAADSTVAGPTELEDGAASYAYPGAQQIYLSYLLSGVLERSDTDSDRALARVTSLDVSFRPRSRRSTVSFVGASVLNLACQPRYVDVPPTPCGMHTQDGWTLDLPTDSQGYRVMAQIDLH